jgi:hypothetical protein
MQKWKARIEILEVQLCKGMEQSGVRKRPVIIAAFQYVKGAHISVGFLRNSAYMTEDFGASAP